VIIVDKANQTLYLFSQKKGRAHNEEFEKIVEIVVRMLKVSIHTVHNWTRHVHQTSVCSGNSELLVCLLAYLFVQDNIDFQQTILTVDGFNANDYNRFRMYCALTVIHNHPIPWSVLPYTRLPVEQQHSNNDQDRDVKQAEEDDKDQDLHDFNQVVHVHPLVSEDDQQRVLVALTVEGNIESLRPGRWLNDTIINRYFMVLQKRDVLSSRYGNQSGGRTVYFKSFFMSYLLNIGHINPKLNGVYLYDRVKTWTKSNLPAGDDLFKFSKLIIAINISNVHWICAAVFMEEKRM
jgi:hypothetical protein